MNTTTNVGLSTTKGPSETSSKDAEVTREHIARCEALLGKLEQLECSAKQETENLKRKLEGLQAARLSIAEQRVKLVEYLTIAKHRQDSIPWNDIKQKQEAIRSSLKDL